ncbi:AI-2E family transporter [Runella zeae]|uniref:AI-2E family transporter n=1 Tax=Runella zeae TaxID=94255 RepID=UPI00048BEA34|nr:AI-2E family transporter [Runella zeae]
MPTSERVNRYLQIVVIIALLMYFTKVITIPMTFGLLVAIVLYPLCKWLENRRWPRSWAIAACLSVVLFISVGLLGIMIWQVAELRKELPRLTTKSDLVLVQLQDWLTVKFGITLDMQISWLRQTANNLSSKLGTVLVGTVNATASLLFNLVIIPLFAALFLHYRGLLMRGVYEIFGTKHQERVKTVATQTVDTYYNYIKGLLLVYLIVGVLNTLGLAIVGIKQAILFGFIASILTIIPYIGIAIGALLPISIAWMMHDSIWYPLSVVAVFGVVQYLEANVIFPWVVGVQLKVNTLASVMALFLGGVIWGVSGMVLFLPFVAIIKVIADNVEEWQPLATFLGPEK